MARVGYGRISDPGQHIAPQLARLADCDPVFYDQKSGLDRDRAQLGACLAYLRAGDTLVCTRLDRLARSVKHLCDIAEHLAGKGVHLLVLDQAIDTATPTGRLLFHVLAAIAEFEVSIRKAQQRAGIIAAQTQGAHVGRQAALDAPEVAEVRARYAAGESAARLARHFRVGRSTLYRYLTGPEAAS